MNLDTLLRQEAQAFGLSDIDLNQELGLFPDVAPVTPAPTPAREWLGFATNPAELLEQTFSEIAQGEMQTLPFSAHKCRFARWVFSATKGSGLGSC